MLAAFVSIGGETLSDAEKRWLERCNPLGVTLFARNIKNPEQVKNLTADIRQVLDRENVLIAVDQEGGRVRRLSGDGFVATASQYVLGQLDESVAAAHAEIISSDLAKVGINLNYAPVLDVLYPQTHPVLKSRCFGADEKKVAHLGAEMIKTYVKNGICPCMKHMPGHGRAAVDPHLGLPVIKASVSEMEKDFYPFAENCSCPMGMTAHIVVDEVDSSLPVTLSSKAIDTLIRGKIGFEGLLVSDAIDMKALSGSVGEKAEAVIAAGCDVVCYCGGKTEELFELSERCPQMSDASLSRLEKVFDVLSNQCSKLSQETIEHYKKAVGRIEEYNEKYDATEVLNQMSNA